MAESKSVIRDRMLKKLVALNQSILMSSYSTTSYVYVLLKPDEITMQITIEIGGVW